MLARPGRAGAQIGGAQQRAARRPAGAGPPRASRSAAVTSPRAAAASARASRTRRRSRSVGPGPHARRRATARPGERRCARRPPRRASRPSSSTTIARRSAAGVPPARAASNRASAANRSRPCRRNARSAVRASSAAASASPNAASAAAWRSRASASAAGRRARPSSRTARAAAARASSSRPAPSRISHRSASRSARGTSPARNRSAARSSSVERAGHVAGPARDPAQVVQRVGGAQLHAEVVEQLGRALQIGAGTGQIAEEGAVDAAVVEGACPPQPVTAQARERGRVRRHRLGVAAGLRQDQRAGGDGPGTCGAIGLAQRRGSATGVGEREGERLPRLVLASVETGPPGDRDRPAQMRDRAVDVVQLLGGQPQRPLGDRARLRVATRGVAHRARVDSRPAWIRTGELDGGERGLGQRAIQSVVTVAEPPSTRMSIRRPSGPRGMCSAWKRP